MYDIHATQIKAARAVLGWSQEELARKAGLAVTTIRNMETGFIPRGKTSEAIRQAIEDAGLEFTEKQGIQKRTNEIVIYEGFDSCDAIFEDIVKTLQKTGGDLLSVMPNVSILDRVLGFDNSQKQKTLLQVNGFVKVRCLTGGAGRNWEAKNKDCRYLSLDQIGPMPYLIYGNRHVMVIAEGGDTFRFFSFQSAAIAQGYRAHFLALWQQAKTS